MFILGGGSKRRKRDTDSLLNDKKNGSKTQIVKDEVEPSLDRVFVPSKKAIFEARKQMLRITNKFNFRNMDLVKSFPYLFEVLW